MLKLRHALLGLAAVAMLAFATTSARADHCYPYGRSVYRGPVYGAPVYGRTYSRVYTPYHVHRVSPYQSRYYSPYRGYYGGYNPYYGRGVGIGVQGNRGGFYIRF